MGTASIRLDSDLVSEAKAIGEVMSRSTAKQVEHWAKIGKIMEDNPDLTYDFVKGVLIAEAEVKSGQVEAYSFG